MEGWRKFLGSLASNGVFTVSCAGTAPKDVDETGRLLSLAKATLLDIGVPDPRRHLVLAAFDNLSTLIVSRSPFTRDDLRAAERHHQHKWAFRSWSVQMRRSWYRRCWQADHGRARCCSAAGAVG